MVPFISEKYFILQNYGGHIISMEWEDDRKFISRLTIAEKPDWYSTFPIWIAEEGRTQEVIYNSSFSTFRPH